jgi:hypothetical protein
MKRAKTFGSDGRSISRAGFDASVKPPQALCFVGKIFCCAGSEVAGVTGLEPAASGVTGQRSNQLSYTPERQLKKLCHNETRFTIAIGICQAINTEDSYF